MAEVYITDLSLNKPIKIGSIPTALSTYSLNTGVLNANTQTTIIWTTTPSQPQLSLWSFGYSIRFGSNLAGYEWPNGASLTNNQATVKVTCHLDVLASNEKTNQVVHKLIMSNGSADTFNYYQFVKAYTFATSVGSSV